MVVDTGWRLTPAAVLYGEAVTTQAFHQREDLLLGEMTANVAGVALFAMTAWLQWRFALARFRRTCGRIDDAGRTSRKTE